MNAADLKVEALCASEDARDALGLLRTVLELMRARLSAPDTLDPTELVRLANTVMVLEQRLSARASKTERIAKVATLKPLLQRLAD